MADEELLERLDRIISLLGSIHDQLVEMEGANYGSLIESSLGSTHETLRNMETILADIANNTAN